MFPSVIKPFVFLVQWQKNVNQMKKKKGKQETLEQRKRIKRKKTKIERCARTITCCCTRQRHAEGGSPSRPSVQQSVPSLSVGYPKKHRCRLRIHLGRPFLSFNAMNHHHLSAFFSIPCPYRTRWHERRAPPVCFALGLFNEYLKDIQIYTFISQLSLRL